MFVSCHDMERLISCAEAVCLSVLLSVRPHGVIRAVCERCVRPPRPPQDCCCCNVSVMMSSERVPICCANLRHSSSSSRGVITKIFR